MLSKVLIELIIAFLVAFLVAMHTGSYYICSVKLTRRWCSSLYAEDREL